MLREKWRDPLIRSQVLYPAELRAREDVALKGQKHHWQPLFVQPHHKNIF